MGWIVGWKKSTTSEAAPTFISQNLLSGQRRHLWGYLTHKALAQGCENTARWRTHYSVRLTIGSGRLAAALVGAKPLFASKLSIAENNSLVRIGFET